MAALPERILLATDVSEDAMVATRAAIDLSNKGGSELHVVHALEFVPPREFASVAPRLKNVSTFSGQGRQLLDQQVEQIGEAGGYRGQMAVLVKPSGLFGRAYMAGIAGFRHLIVYPRLMRGTGREWRDGPSGQRRNPPPPSGRRT